LHVRRVVAMPSDRRRKVLVAVDMSNWAEMAFDCECFCNDYYYYYY